MHTHVKWPLLVRPVGTRPPPNLPLILSILLCATPPASRLSEILLSFVILLSILLLISTTYQFSFDIRTVPIVFHNRPITGYQWGMGGALERWKAPRIYRKKFYHLSTFLLTKEICPCILYVYASGTKRYHRPIFFSSLTFSYPLVLLSSLNTFYTFYCLFLPFLTLRYLIWMK